ncbi:hypothetical protein PO878_06025 [Iamia majanohamensis]|uniref:DUF4214 domain-containing protein n=1 Tax=Iamia majanohamensis TaxID=467976 RepID=A0AAE9YBV6_9ACTN|nr:hypothetical protein [Iamia majanohamensis]WCO68283.1 hypothetical protein PO878_06025 [Iamia majanohamensis]
MTTTRPTTRRLLAAVALCAALLAGTLASAPAGAQSQENTTYVRSLYADLLDRVNTTGDDAGVAYWANRLDRRSEPRVFTVQQLMKAGSEYYGQIVDINYALFLDRTADPGGRDFYVQGWRNRRFTLERVVTTLGGSNEYYNRQGATTASFVDAIYFDVLGRRADDGGRQFGIDYVSSRGGGVSGRGQYVALLVRSREKRGQVVDDAFGTFLGRAPTAQERQQFVDALTPTGLRREDFDAQLVASTEYYSRNS